MAAIRGVDDQAEGTREQDGIARLILMPGQAEVQDFERERFGDQVRFEMTAEAILQRALDFLNKLQPDTRCKPLTECAFETAQDRLQPSVNWPIQLLSDRRQ